MYCTPVGLIPYMWNRPTWLDTVCFLFYQYIVSVFLCVSYAEEFIKSKRCNQTAQVSPPPRIGLDSIKREKNTQGGQNSLIIHHLWNFLGFVLHIPSEMFSPCTSMPFYSAFFPPLLLQSCVHNHPTNKHSLYLQKAFECVYFSSHLVNWLLKNVPI